MNFHFVLSSVFIASFSSRQAPHPLRTATPSPQGEGCRKRRATNGRPYEMCVMCVGEAFRLPRIAIRRRREGRPHPNDRETVQTGSGRPPQRRAIVIRGRRHFPSDPSLRSRMTEGKCRAKHLARTMMVGGGLLPLRIIQNKNGRSKPLPYG